MQSGYEPCAHTIAQGRDFHSRPASIHPIIQITSLSLTGVLGVVTGSGPLPSGP